MIGIRQITPNEATEMLLHNEKNRLVSAKTVEKYARDMLSGRFGIADSAIVIAKNGSLLNGQHRLMACVKAGVPFVSIVRTDAEESEMINMDRGRIRTIGDNIKISGIAPEGKESLYTNTSIIATAKLIHCILNGIPLGNGTISAQETVSIIKRYEKALSVAKNIMTTSTSNKSSASFVIRDSPILCGIVKAFESGVPEHILLAFGDAVVFGYKTERSAEHITNDRLRVASSYRGAIDRSRKVSKSVKSREDKMFCTENAIFRFVNGDGRSIIGPAEKYPLAQVSISANDSESEVQYR